jgi:hypothetical protein
MKLLFFRYPLNLFVTHADFVVISMFREHVQVNVIGVLNQKTLEILHKFLESRTVLGVGCPTIRHDVIKLTITMRWLFQAPRVLALSNCDYRVRNLNIVPTKRFLFNVNNT